MTSPHPLLVLLQTLSAELPLSQAKVEAQLGSSLQAQASQNNPAFLLLEGGSCLQGRVERVELRLPNQHTHRLDGLLILHIAPAAGLSLNTLLEELGELYTLVVPHPRQPATAPLIYQFAQSWGTLRVGVSRDTEALQLLVMDVNR